jgi:hypothetical protein
VTASAFELHARLAADTFALADFPLCRLLLMNDAQGILPDADRFAS